MENKKILLEKLGFSKEYVKFLDDKDVTYNFSKLDYTSDTEVQLDLSLNTLILEKTDIPLHNSFVFNDRKRKE